MKHCAGGSAKNHARRDTTTAFYVPSWLIYVGSMLGTWLQCDQLIYLYILIYGGVMTDTTVICREHINSFKENIPDLLIAIFIFL